MRPGQVIMFAFYVEGVRLAVVGIKKLQHRCITNQMPEVFEFLLCSGVYQNIGGYIHRGFQRPQAGLFFVGCKILDCTF